MSRQHHFYGPNRLHFITASCTTGCSTAGSHSQGFPDCGPFSVGQSHGQSGNGLAVATHFRGLPSLNSRAFLPRRRVSVLPFFRLDYAHCPLYFSAVSWEAGGRMSFLRRRRLVQCPRNNWTIGTSVTPASCLQMRARTAALHCQDTTLDAVKVRRARGRSSEV